MNSVARRSLRHALVLSFALLGCAPSSTVATPADVTAPADATSADVTAPADATSADESPPTTGAADLERWLATGAYQRWRCEAARHAARPGSAHSANRICSNARLSDSVGTGEHPVGAASVKELFNAAGALTGYAVAVRVRSGGGGAGWYWYERIAPGRIVADSTGDRGGARSICVTCHDGAPRDEVFTGVR